MRPEQLTTTNIAKAFRLIEETIILVSDRGTVAIPEGGVFTDVDYLDQWIVQGDKVTGPRFSMGASTKWTPQSFKPPVRSSISAVSSLPSTSRQVRLFTCSMLILLQYLWA